MYDVSLRLLRGEKNLKGGGFHYSPILKALPWALNVSSEDSTFVIMSSLTNRNLSRNLKQSGSCLESVGSYIDA